MNARSWMWRSPGAVVLLALMTWPPSVGAMDLFREKVTPFLKKYCAECHNAKRARGELDLGRYARDADVTADFRRWNHVIQFIRGGEMPPEDSPQPPLEERNAVAAAIEEILLVEARKHAGDPGLVLPRRLSNTEFDLSIRDLTGVPIQATKQFPVDPAGGEGFDNTGEALGMTPNLLAKYLQASDFVSKHLVLKPGGIAFAPFPVVSYNERKKLTEQALLDFYRRHEVQLGDYLEAAWRYRHRGAEDRGLSVGEWAARHKLSGKYLALLSKTLDDARNGTGYLKLLGTRWESLPAPRMGVSPPAEFRDLERWITFAQARWNQKEPQLIVANAGNWPISHLALRARVATNRDQFSADVLKGKHLIRFGRLNAKKDQPVPPTTLFLRIDRAFDDAPAGVVILRRPTFTKGDSYPRNQKDADASGAETLRAVLEREAPDLARRLKFGQHPTGGELDPDSLAILAPAELEIPLASATVKALLGKQLVVECELDGSASPEAAVHLRHSVGTRLGETPSLDTELLVRPESSLAKKFIASGKLFCAAFPNRFFYVDRERGLAAGFHLVEGFFRDDRPLVEKVLTDAERKELDRLWRDFEFITDATETLLRGFVWFERAERHVLHDKRFDFLRAEDPLLTGDELLSKFERLYLEKMGVKLAGGELKPIRADERFDMIHGFFKQIRTGLETHRATTREAEKHGLTDLLRLATRAYGRDLKAEEAASLKQLYQRLRKQGMDVEDSLRGTFTAVLMSPHFFYRIPPAAAGREPQPLPDEALARRLSYFLWSSLPDEPLLELARNRKLQDPAVLRTQVRRMMQDPRIEAFAREFFGQWLRYRDYLSKDTIPAGTFPGYDGSLRQAMFEEPTRLITHLLQEDLPVDELLHSDVTFVNEKLARHYGGPIEAQHRSLLTARVEAYKSKGLPVPADLKNEWIRVEGLRKMGRGGLFGMPVVLARNSAGQRPSPVKRGFWVVHHLLGQHFPPPPADIPELPKTEKESARTIREMLAQHTSNRSCALCHVHFDGLGLTMEGFDAIGRSRTRDSAGRAVETSGILPGGKKAEGVSGLIEYIETERRRDFELNLCRKLLGYALGRSVTLSDHALIEEMQKNLRAERRFSVLLETVVLSRQFRQQRGKDVAASSP